MRTLHGTPASPGVARGPVVVVRPGPVVAGGSITPDQADAEVARLEAAMAAASEELATLADRMRVTNPDEAGIFDAHALIATDPALLEGAEHRIREQSDGAIAAVRAAAGEFAEALRDTGDELLAARAADLDDVVNGIVAQLTGTARDVPHLEVPSIVAAPDLPPSVTVRIRDQLLGLALQEGSRTAHAAILAQAMGIPAVVGVAGLLDAVEADRPAVAGVDGSAGTVVLDPDARASRELDTAEGAFRADRARARAEAGQGAVTRDGVEVTLLANIGGPSEARLAVELGAAGVGLFRTEFLFVERGTPPTEDEQVTAYRAVVDAFAPGPVTIRLLDVGGDKPIPYVPIAPEANPFLGVRSLRLAWDQPDLFLTQLRAAMRAASDRAPGTVQVMAPMIADAGDADLLLRLAASAREQLVTEGIAHGEVALGVMLEIPSAVLVADTYLPRLAFASLGTNDLLQYTVAVDRGNRALDRYQDSLHPALLRLVRQAVQASEAAGTELSVCGEMAGDPVAALALVAVGIRKLSMAAPSVARVRRAVRAADATLLAEASRLALAGPTAAETRAGLAALLEQALAAAG